MRLSVATRGYWHSPYCCARRRHERERVLDAGFEGCPRPFGGFTGRPSDATIRRRAPKLPSPSPSAWLPAIWVKCRRHCQCIGDSCGWIALARSTRQRLSGLGCRAATSRRGNEIVDGSINPFCWRSSVDVGGELALRAKFPPQSAGIPSQRVGTHRSAVIVGGDSGRSWMGPVVSR